MSTARRKGILDMLNSYAQFQNQLLDHNHHCQTVNFANMLIIILK